MSPRHRHLPAASTMTKRETIPLAIAARQAYAHQADLANLEPGETFDSWRHAQVLAVVGKPGLTACSHDDYRPLMAHFQHLAGRDASAYRNLVHTGPASPAAASPRPCRSGAFIHSTTCAESEGGSVGPRISAVSTEVIA